MNAQRWDRMPKNGFLEVKKDFKSASPELLRITQEIMINRGTGKYDKEISPVWAACVGRVLK